MTGAGTFSAAEDFLVPLKAMKRATLIGSATAGSTGQPLSVALYGTNARICTKWDRDPVLDRAVEFLTAGAKR